MPSRSPARKTWQARRWCTVCRSYYSSSASCGCGWSWGDHPANAAKGAAHAWSKEASHTWNKDAHPSATWHSQSPTQATAASASHSAPWSGSQARTRSTSSGRRRERSLSRQRKSSTAALGGSWEQREALEKLRAAARACSDAGDADGAAAVEAQVDAALEAMYEALPMAARIQHWENRRTAQVNLVDRLGELAALQTAKLAKTKATLLVAQDDLATHERKLAELAAEQAAWGPGTDLAASDPYGGGDTWDN